MSEEKPKTTAYVTIRGSRSHRQVHRDASPASSTSPSPFAALVLGHPDGTSTRFEVTYRDDAHLRDGSEGALVDLTMKGSARESVTLCRVLVPSDGKGEPVPSYPLQADTDTEPYAGMSEEAMLELASRSTHYCDGLSFTECGIVSKLVRHTSVFEDVDCPECRNLLCLKPLGLKPVNAREAAEEMARHYYTEARATTPPKPATALQRAAVEAYNFLCNAELSDFIREHDKEIRLRLAAALDAEGVNVDDDRDASFLDDAPAITTADPARAFTGAPEATGTASAVEAFEGRRS